LTSSCGRCLRLLFHEQLIAALLSWTTAVHCCPSTHYKIRAANDTVAHGNDMIVPHVSQPAALHDQLLPAAGTTPVLTAGSVTRAVTLTAVLIFQQCMLVKICPFKLLIARQHGSHQCCYRHTWKSSITVNIGQ